MHRLLPALLCLTTACWPLLPPSANPARQGDDTAAPWDTGTAWDSDSSRETDGPNDNGSEDNGSDDGEPTRCSDDELEPNDTLETATEVDSLNYFTASGTLCDGSDVDRFILTSVFFCEVYVEGTALTDDSPWVEAELTDRDDFVVASTAGTESWQMTLPFSSVEVLVLNVFQADPDSDEPVEYELVLSACNLLGDS